LAAKGFWDITDPLKVKILMWLIVKRKLDTLDLLSHKGISQVGLYVLSDEDIDSCQHIFVGWKYVAYIWDSLKLELLLSGSPTTMSDAWTCRRTTHVKTVVHLEWDISLMAVCWLLWHERNNRIFLH